MADDEGEGSGGGGFTCPHCGAVLDAAPAAAAPQDVVCPRCGGLTVIPAADGSFEPEDAPTEQADEREDELSALRIRQLATARRAAYRSRSYCVVAAIFCVVAVVQLTWTAIRFMRAAGVGVRPVAYLFVASLAAFAAAYFFRKATAFDREAKQSALPEPTAEPDFSKLSDGSQRWKNLEDVR